MVQIEALFARAEHAYREQRFDAARAALLQVVNVIRDHPAPFHLLALVERDAGRRAEAEAAFRKALALAPGDPQIHNNYAVLLETRDDHDRALLHYGNALAASPRFAPALINRGMLLTRLERFDEALADLDRAIALEPRNALAFTARGGLLRAMGRLDEAAGDFDAAIAIEPLRAPALHGRARVALERGEPQASALFRRCLAEATDDPDVVIGLASALEAEGDPSGLATMKQAVEARPEWVEGHEELARMSAEAGEKEITASYERALAARPADRALHRSHWQSLARAEGHALALQAIDRARPVIGEDRGLRLIEAMCAIEAGQLERARRALEDLGDDHGTRLLRARLALFAGEPRRAEQLLWPLVQTSDQDMAAWAHIDLAWRLLGDERHAWLSLQPGLHAWRDVGLSEAELSGLADLLRNLHRTRAHPIGQSLRGGTQTRGRLFERMEPEIRQLRAAINEAVRAHVAAMPAQDDTHPLLRHRNEAFGFEGSWSVRLQEGGFHVSHIHPRGILSSAFYVSIPALADDERHEGWLDLGTPPPEMSLPLGPIALVEPVPGRLALFPSYFYHGTRPFAAGERLTVAFDAIAC